MRKSWLLFILVSAFASFSAQAQNETFRSEFTYGINFNTNGGIIGGGALRYSRTINEKWQHFWGLEIVEVKHPKEYPAMGQSGGRYIWGKTNYMYVVRPEYGRKYSLFRKAPENGVEVHAIVGAGPSLGLMVPYYIVFDRTEYRPIGPGVKQQIGPTDYRTERYDPVNNADHKQFDNIMGNAGFLTGFGEMDVNIGAHIKTALSFEYGRYPESITGIETGFLLEAYPNTMVIIPEADNFKVFTSVYLTLYYGRRK